jgi:hypothetical protein
VQRGGGGENRRREEKKDCWIGEMNSECGERGLPRGSSTKWPAGFLCKINGDHEFSLHVEIKFNSRG